MNDPKFIYDKYYYFDILNNTIHGKEKYSYNYFHELSHYLDHKKKIYNEISIAMHQYIQGLSMFGFFIMYIDTTAFLFFFGVYSLWVLQEEIRADIFAIKQKYKVKKNLKNRFEYLRG